MCVATLGVVIGRDGDWAVVEIGERSRCVSAALFPETEIGDYVVISALTIVDRLNEPPIDDTDGGETFAGAEDATARV
jgi:hydrogenase maturation factor